MYEWPDLTCLCVYVGVCLNDMPAVFFSHYLGDTDVIDDSSGQDVGCVRFYWIYLFLITIRSKFSLFHKKKQVFVFHVAAGWKRYGGITLTTTTTSTHAHTQCAHAHVRYNCNIEEHSMP